MTEKVVSFFMPKTTKEQTPSIEKTKGGVKSRQAITLLFQGKAEEALNILVTIMRDSKTQASVRVAAANKILDKVIPNIQAMEVTGEESGPLVIKIVKDAQALKSDE